MLVVVWGDPTYMSPECNLFSHSGNHSKKTDTRTTVWPANHSRVTTSRTPCQHTCICYGSAHDNQTTESVPSPSTSEGHIKQNKSTRGGETLPSAFICGFQISHRYIVILIYIRHCDSRRETVLEKEWNKRESRGVVLMWKHLYETIIVYDESMSTKYIK